VGTDWLSKLRFKIGKRIASFGLLGLNFVFLLIITPNILNKSRAGRKNQKEEVEMLLRKLAA
jgi:hypothetical protein